MLRATKFTGQAPLSCTRCGPYCVDIQRRTGASACYCLFSAFIPRLPKLIDISCPTNGLIAAACMHLPLFFLGLVRDRASLLEICSSLQASQRDRITVALFFFDCPSHNESGPNPLPAIWKFSRLSTMCELLRWPLIVFQSKKKQGKITTKVYKKHNLVLGQKIKKLRQTL